jgi:hypothetical protein
VVAAGDVGAAHDAQQAVVVGDLLAEVGVEVDAEVDGGCGTRVARRAQRATGRR